MVKRTRTETIPIFKEAVCAHVRVQRGNHGRMLKVKSEHYVIIQKIRIHCLQCGVMGRESSTLISCNVDTGRLLFWGLANGCIASGFEAIEGNSFLFRVGCKKSSQWQLDSHDF